jgi:hypothetical protein
VGEEAASPLPDPSTASRLVTPGILASPVTPGTLMTPGTNEEWDNGTLDDAPVPRTKHLSVWTGTVMIVWGGYGTIPYWPWWYGDERSLSSTGARYDPLTDTWTPIAADSFMGARDGATAVWTGSVVLIWGGIPCCTFPTASSPNSGYIRNASMYDPATDTWSILPGQGEAYRYDHSAVWTGPPSQRDDRLGWEDPIATRTWATARATASPTRP